MYLDTCILAKLFAPEPDSDVYAARATGSVLVSSEIAHAEVFSALLRKERMGEISLEQRSLGWLRFERQVRQKSIYLAPVDGAIVRHAREIMLEVHPHVALRTLDAMHLATYFAVLSGPLLTNDRRMRDAAKLLQIALA
jgi:predicted nucleic acid-binding protein